MIRRSRWCSLVRSLACLYLLRSRWCFLVRSRRMFFFLNSSSFAMLLLLEFFFVRKGALLHRTFASLSVSSSFAMVLHLEFFFVRDGASSYVRFVVSSWILLRSLLLRILLQQWSLLRSHGVWGTDVVVQTIVSFTGWGWVVLWPLILRNGNLILFISTIWAPDFDELIFLAISILFEFFRYFWSCLVSNLRPSNSYFLSYHLSYLDWWVTYNSKNYYMANIPNRPWN